MSVELLQHPWMCGGVDSGFSGRWLKYISKKVRATSSPKPSALLVPRMVPLPVHNMVVVIEIIQKKELHFWELRDMLLTTSNDPVAAVKYCWRVVSS